MKYKKIKLQQVRNVFNALNRNKNSVLYGAYRITKTQINKNEKSGYPKDKVFLGFYQELENESELYFDEKKQQATAAAYMSFAEQWTDTDCSLTF